MKRRVRHHYSTLGLPCALALLLAGCGGGSDPATTSAAPAAAGMSMSKALATTAGEGTEIALTPVNVTASGAERGDKYQDPRHAHAKPLLCGTIFPFLTIRLTCGVSTYG